MAVGAANYKTSQPRWSRSPGEEPLPVPFDTGRGEPARTEGPTLRQFKPEIRGSRISSDTTFLGFDTGCEQLPQLRRDVGGSLGIAAGRGGP